MSVKSGLLTFEKIDRFDWQQRNDALRHPHETISDPSGCRDFAELYTPA